MPGTATQLSVVGGADPPAPAAGDPVSPRRPVITIRGLSKSFNDTVIPDESKRHEAEYFELSTGCQLFGWSSAS